MSNNNSKVLIVGVVTFLIGAFIGLVVLGWWIFPVQWTGGTLQHVDSEIQDEWLRMAIDSYSLNQDQERAQAHYDALGPQKESILLAIAKDPGEQNPTSIVDFGLAVGVESLAELESVPTPAVQPTKVDLPIGTTVSRPIWAALVALICLFGLGLLVILIIILRASRPKEPVKEPPSPDLEDKPIEHETVPVAPDELKTKQPDVNEAWWETAPDESTSPTEKPADIVPDIAPEAGEEFPLGDAASLGAAAWAISSLTEEEEPSQFEVVPETETTNMETSISTPYLVTDEDLWQAPSNEDLGRLEIETASEAIPDEDLLILAPLDIEEIPEFDAEAEAVFAPESAVEEPPEFDGEAETLIAPAPIAEETPEDEYEAETLQDLVAKFKHDLTYVEGIGEVYAQKLAQSGILTLKDLLEKGATPKGRQEIAEASGISPKLILKWVNHVDLFRIKGVGQEYADLLEWSGVDTVIELATRNPQNLVDKMISVNEEKKLVRKPPVLPQVESWVEQAKHLPRVIHY
jgi:predicted flap endonuclease-1-like 5' DNA nuclease